MTPATIQSLAALFASMAAFLGGMYLVSTRPLMKRMDDMRRDFGERLTRIETRLDKIEERLTAVEKKVDALEIKAWR
jgi:F0F1-type ATP synthase membrane subunit b/b'